MDKFEQFKQAYDEAIQTIDRLSKPGPYQPQMDQLVKWMLQTDANPYSYLPEQWAGAVYTAEGFASLLNCIHHALYDDGDITFVTVNDEPRIVFMHKFDQDFEQRVLHSQERNMMERYNSQYQIDVLVIEPNQFGQVYDNWYLRDIHQCFIFDSARHGVQFAVDHYSKSHKMFDISWVQQFEQQIIQKRQQLITIGILHE